MDQNCCNRENCLMSYRYIRRRKGYILLIITTLFLLYIWTDGFGFYNSITDYSYDYHYETDCRFPCIGRFCLNCGTPRTTTVKIVDIAEHLKLKQVLRYTDKQESQNGSDSEQVCKRPSFDLKHDSVKYAFFSMPPLNCSKEELFYIEDDVFKFNRTQLRDRNIEKCKYYAIERASDDFSSLTEPLTKDKQPYSVKLMHDFIRIKCFLKKEEKQNKNTEAESNREQPDKTIAADSAKTKLHNISSTAERNGSVLINYLAVLEKLSENEEAIHNGSQNENEKNEGFDIVEDVELNEIDKSDGNNLKEAYQDNEEDSDEMDMHDYWYDRLFEIEEQADFDQFLVQIHPKPEVFQRIAKKHQSRLAGSKPQMNVIMFGLDSMSHLAFQRKLPKVYGYLKNTLEAVILDGYNIVGDATTAALIPMLTGQTEMELPEARKNRFDSETVDVYPLVWKLFKEKGYVTLFAEDEPSIGVFNLRLNGFHTQPTDHYMRPFWQALWDSDLRKDSPRYCTGNVPHHMYLLNYLKDYFVKYHNVSKFAFMFGSELTHWDNNPGEYMENDLLKLFTFLKENGHLDNTLLFLFGDHGARYNRVRKTVQGKMEERLPFMALTFPKWFREKYSKLNQNLIKNSNRLTTPFDIHETLLDILDLKRTRIPVGINQRGISLLREIPESRTCDDAHIAMHWCTCLKQLDLDARDKHVVKSIETLMGTVNQLTRKLRHFCTELKFQKLLFAYLLVPNEKVLMFQWSQDGDNRVANFTRNINIDHAHFQITIETAPNNGLYEATVQVNMTSGVYTVLGTEISRLDMYGEQPACIQEKYPDLRKYCYCKK